MPARWTPAPSVRTGGAAWRQCGAVERSDARVGSRLAGGRGTGAGAQLRRGLPPYGVQERAVDWRAFDLKMALAAARTLHLAEVDATNPDLRAFFAHGGKVLMTHGWADPLTPPLN